ncbi:MAG: glycosyltransferase family 39 protein, partial [Chloroflexi bacterium]|nr:glycosyltransferase family 39 protein [Chloroflexota bacterium]
MAQQTLQREISRPGWTARRWAIPGLPKALPLPGVRPWVGLAAIFSLGIALRLFRLGDQSLWLDEAFSVTLSRKPVLEMLRLIVLSDSHPPLYYLLLHFWMILGDSEVLVRLLSALLSGASILTMYALGRAMYSHSVGLTAALILALSPFHIWYAQEARMYALLSLGVLASAYFLVRALQTNHVKHWTGFVFTTTLALYSDTGAIWYVAAITLFGLLSWRSQKGG